MIPKQFLFNTRTFWFSEIYPKLNPIILTNGIFFKMKKKKMEFFSDEKETIESTKWINLT